MALFAHLHPTLLLRRMAGTWIRWQGYVFLADQMKQGRGARVACLVRWSIVKDPHWLGRVMLMAIVHAEVEVARACLARQMDPNVSYAGNTVLHWALVAYRCTHAPARRSRSLVILKDLLACGADIDQQNRHGRSAWQEVDHRPEEVGSLLRAARAHREAEVLDRATAPVDASCLLAPPPTVRRL